MTEITTSDKMRANSAHARINIPLNLNNWSQVDDKYHDDLTWFHQHVLDDGLTWTQVQEAVNYDKSSVFKFLTGTSSGSYDNFCKSIRSYKSLMEKRRSIKQVEFAPNRISKLIFATLDYALANNSMTMLVGNSCMGKSTAMMEWWHQNNHGRTVYVDCPPVGGQKGFLGAIARKVGVNAQAPIPQMYDGIIRAFNSNRILLIDNMHRVLPRDPRSACVAFDILQSFYDATGCAVGVSGTARLDAMMKGDFYQFEQITGRIGTPIYLPSELVDDDWLPIVKQFYPKPSKPLLEQVRIIASGEGRIRQICERLKLASRIAAKSKSALTEDHFFKAVGIRRELEKHNTTTQKKGA